MWLPIPSDIILTLQVKPDFLAQKLSRLDHSSRSNSKKKSWNQLALSRTTQIERSTFCLAILAVLFGYPLALWPQPNWFSAKKPPFVHSSCHDHVPKPCFFDPSENRKNALIFRLLDQNPSDRSQKLGFYKALNDINKEKEKFRFLQNFLENLTFRPFLTWPQLLTALSFRY